jgi:hypothetical protein
MKKILVEIFATTSCDGTHGTMPTFIGNLASELGVDVEFVPYLMWDMDSSDTFPQYMAAHLAKIRSGETTGGGVFIDGEWFPQRPHNADDIVKIRGKFLEAAERSDPKTVSFLGNSTESIKMDSAVTDVVSFANSVVTKEFGSFSTDFGAMWFFEGSIKELNIDRCPVEKFRYKGYDINKLIDIAEKHPELFANNDGGEDNAEKESGGAKVEIDKANIDDIDVSLVSFEDMRDNKYHPCVIVGYNENSEYKMYKAISEKFGGAGYKAVRRTDWWTCGWMGIAPKDILYRDRGYVTPCEIPNESVLCLLCFMGGGNYHPQFERIGIARKMIKQAIADAGTKGYRRVEAYASQEIAPVLTNCGFACSEITKNNGETAKYFYYDIK